MKLFHKLALLVSLLLIGTTLSLSAAFYLIERQSIRRQADEERHAIQSRDTSSASLWKNFTAFPG